jgi:hypothetical protein
LDPKDYGRSGHIKGTVVAPSAPREDDGTYWGYTTRMASSIKDVFDSCPFPEGYDLKIGTSERGDRSVEDKQFKLPTFEHSLIVFGGVAGIEECVDADENIKLPGSQSKKLFDLWYVVIMDDSGALISWILTKFVSISLSLEGSTHVLTKVVGQFVPKKPSLLVCLL